MYTSSRAGLTMRNEQSFNAKCFSILLYILPYDFVDICGIPVAFFSLNQVESNFGNLKESEKIIFKLGIYFWGLL